MYMHKIDSIYFSTVLFFTHLKRVDNGSYSLQNKLWEEILEFRFYNFKFRRGKRI